MCDGIASLDITPLNFSISAVCSGLCEVLQQSQLQKFHFDFFRLCGLQFCECASFTAVRKFHRRVAHLSSLRACLCATCILFMLISSNTSDTLHIKVLAFTLLIVTILKYVRGKYRSDAVYRIVLYRNDEKLRWKV